MESLKELYRIGRGPSSSHTIAPTRAAELFAEENPHGDRFRATLYGSLSKTGRGHMTDTAILDVLGSEKCQIVFSDKAEEELPHPNTMVFEAFDADGAVTASMDVYKLSTFGEIRDYCTRQNLRICDYVYETEGTAVKEYLAEIWQQMKRTIQKGLEAEGILQGGLEVHRKARYLYRQNHIDESPQTRENRLVCAFAYAVSEENADGGIIVTAPTCGASGVLPATLYYMQQYRRLPDESIVDALATAGMIGNLIKSNASISGAECGCQAEVGSACSMAAAGLAELFAMEIDQIEYAAEVAMEHHLGLTCDPISGLVQIPCIERNAVAAMRAINALSLANFLTHTRKISFDVVVKTMYETGRDLFSKYRETSEGGLAKTYFE